MELATLHFDSYHIVNTLQEQGFSKKQAEGILKVVQEIKLSGASTKQDILETENRLKTELGTEIQAVRSELKEDFQSKFNMLTWMVGINMTMTAGIMLALLSPLFG